MATEFAEQLLPTTTTVADEQQHIAFVSVDEPTRGHLVELVCPLVDGGDWDVRDITEKQGLALAATLNNNAMVTSWTDFDSKHVVYVSSDGRVIELWKNLSLVGDSNWFVKDLTANAVPADVAGGPAKAPLARTGAGGGIASCFDPHVNHVFYVATDGHVQELSCAGSTWYFKDLTVPTGAPAAHYGESLIGWCDPDYVHAAYISGDAQPPGAGNVWELYAQLHPQAGQGSWRSKDLTAEAKPTPPKARHNGSLTSWVSPGSRDSHIAFVTGERSDEAQLVALVRNDAKGQWTCEQLTAPIGAPPAWCMFRGSLTSWADPYHEHVVYVSDNGNVQELYRPVGQPTANWARRDFTNNEPHAPRADRDVGSLTSWVTAAGQGYKHVAFRAEDGAAHEVYCGLGGPAEWRNHHLDRVGDKAVPKHPYGLSSWSDIAVLTGKRVFGYVETNPLHPTFSTVRVPRDVRTIGVTASGGPGGFGTGNSGGPGGALKIEGSADIVPGEVLTVVVGGFAHGGATGPGYSWGGLGGAGGNGGKDGGGGGGSTSVFGMFSGLLVEAAGGGGAGGAGGLGASGGYGGIGGLQPGDGGRGANGGLGQGGRGGKGGDPTAGLDGTDANPASTAGGGGGGGGGHLSGGGGAGSGNTSGGGGGGGGRSHMAGGFRLIQEEPSERSVVELNVPWSAESPGS